MRAEAIMRERVARYAAKAVAAGLAEEGAPLFEILDGGFVWCRPKEPYRAMIALLAARSDGHIRPEDHEKRAFLHEIPVARSFEAAEFAKALAGHKAAVLADGGAVACGTESPEVAFTSFSSVCFVCYVKFVADALAAGRRGVPPTAEERRVLALALDPSRRPTDNAPVLARGPFEDGISARAAVVEAGRATVKLGLVDACFGNVSYAAEGLLHISRTGSPLDELEAGIVSVPLDGSGSAGSGASSELATHLHIVQRTRARAVLHGHPRHAVIASLDCDRDDCPGRGSCHLQCEEKRFAGGVPIVPGEAGTGPRGSYNTVPDALGAHAVAIVYGHGAFAAGAVDFNDALQSVVDVERACFDEIAARLL